ncbi:hypothetical protein [Sphingomonas sp. S-NIH.Pt15_0812]|jgi:hypothetical protein|uniref:hypothetical protein n=1 Tax=Sphingomonas sp. S-NIH.Pt15_0812 TaxID=1920129 RepID=UPI000F7EC4C3|nr:hypothetical protein [Sphingomonas sp. S-NIH.Pt15_0812]RSU50996.1 hypothetical protein BRX43_08255 [Sphingomonas sp. S-NIH.Pt15_0812]
MTKDTARPGLANFALDDDDDVPVPTPEQRAAAKQGGERLGFKSEPTELLTKSAPPPAPARMAVYTANFHIRTTPADRDRYDDFAYRHRMKKGAAMTLLLDLAEEAEAARAKKQ